MGRTYELIIKDSNKPTKLVDLTVDVAISGYLSRCANCYKFIEAIWRGSRESIKQPVAGRCPPSLRSSPPC